MLYRELNKQEIQILESNKCRAEDWGKVHVAPDFTTENLYNVSFYGTCKLGVYKDDLKSNRKITSSGIYNCTLENVEVSNNVLIREVGQLNNYFISKDVIIENVGTLAVTGETTFGNGIEIDVLNEGGGRELPIFDQLSAQMAYLIVVFRHDTTLVSKLKSIIQEYSKKKESTTGHIGSGSRIQNCGNIENVWVGDHAFLKGVISLTEGSIIGEEGTKTFVGPGVIARHFIIQSGSSVDSGALLDHTFIGQGVTIGKQFSIENSVFFANSEGFHGEAVSIFAGPYTVTHHKSSLLIAGMFSFFNAGSGTNQSNHMYKLGPLHQGVVDRGSKTGSFSYLLWPSKIGSFSVVMGKHGNNFDTSDLPFSYITVENEKSFLTPAMNLITVGTRRDSEKWAKRDRRKGSIKHDRIVFDLFNPFVIGQVVKGINLLSDLYEKTPKQQESINYRGVRIKRLMLKSCKKYYEMALYIFIGNQMLQWLTEEDASDFYETIKRKMELSLPVVSMEWMDLSGLVVPQEILQDVLIKIKTDPKFNIQKFDALLDQLYAQYKDYTWSWTRRLLKDQLGIDPGKITRKQIKELITLWKENSVRLNNMILNDGKKEFDANSQIGFGLAEEASMNGLDFKNVRGTYEENSFIVKLQEEKLQIEKMADKICETL